MRKRKSVLIVLTALIVVFGIIFAVMYHFKDRFLTDEPQTATTQLAEETMEYYQFEDAFDTVTLLGKTPEETGVNEKYFTENTLCRVLQFDTVLFGKGAYGSIYFTGEAKEGEKTASTVFILTKERTFEQCKEQLIALYGEPDSEWETPYVEVNGGAQSGCRFRDDGLKIELTQGSERDYVEIEINSCLAE